MYLKYTLVPMCRSYMETKSWSFKSIAPVFFFGSIVYTRNNELKSA